MAYDLAGMTRGAETVSKESICTNAANFSTMKLSVSHMQAAFARTLMDRVFYLWIIALPAYGIYFSFFKLKAHSSGPSSEMAFFVNIGILIICGTLMIFGYLGCFVGFGTRRVVADAERRTVTFERGIRSLFRPSLLEAASYSFDDVAAIQICTVDEKTWGECGPLMAWEINLVLRDPPGRRINIVAHSNGRRIEREARQFAAFLGKPLIDHRDKEKESGFHLA